MSTTVVVVVVVVVFRDVLVAHLFSALPGGVCVSHVEMRGKGPLFFFALFCFFFCVGCVSKNKIIGTFVHNKRALSLLWFTSFQEYYY